jgi:hypothetical protein
MMGGFLIVFIIHLVGSMMGQVAFSDQQTRKNSRVKKPANHIKAWPVIRKNTKKHKHTKSTPTKMKGHGR